MTHLRIILACALPLMLAAACTGGDRTDADLRDAEMAIAQGDMKVATSVADHIMGDKNITGLTSRQLARLSMIYMQIADSADTGGNISTATKLYRSAYSANADSAALYYSTVPSHLTPHARMLAAIAGALDSPADLNDSIPADTIP